jgi:hypothetical protein
MVKTGFEFLLFEIVSARLCATSNRIKLAAKKRQRYLSGNNVTANPGLGQGFRYLNF